MMQVFAQREIKKGEEVFHCLDDDVGVVGEPKTASEMHLAPQIFSMAEVVV